MCVCRRYVTNPSFFVKLDVIQLLAWLPLSFLFYQRSETIWKNTEETGVRDGGTDCCFSNHQKIQVRTRALTYVKGICLRDDYGGLQEHRCSRSLFEADGWIESGLAVIMKRLAGATKREFVHLCQRCEDF